MHNFSVAVGHVLGFILQLGNYYTKRFCLYSNLSIERAKL
jgi:hypothetical protein